LFLISILDSYFLFSLPGDCQTLAIIPDVENVQVVTGGHVILIKP
jgi:hypothetical protein